MLRKFLLALIAAVMSIQMVCFADDAADTAMKFEIVSSNSSPKNGDEIEVSFNLSGGNSINNFTFYLVFDTDFYKLDTDNIPDMQDCLKFGDSPIVSKELIEQQAKRIPREGDTDYFNSLTLGEPDGIKTAAELGKIKLAHFISDSTDLKTIEADGTLFKLNFEITGSSNEEGTICIEPVPENSSGFNDSPADDCEVEVDYVPLTLKIKEETLFTYENDDPSSGIVTGCTSFSSGVIEIPEGVVEIADGFLGNDANKEIVKKVTIPNTVKRIGDNAFDGCTNLTEINIPKNLSEIGKYVFRGCTNLKDISFR